jgi:hypothetical protein
MEWFADKQEALKTDLAPTGIDVVACRRSVVSKMAMSEWFATSV